LAIARLYAFPPITCVYLLWSYSKAGVKHRALFDAVAQRVIPEFGRLDRCSASMLPWCFAHAGEEGRGVCRAASLDTLRPLRLEEHAPRDVAVMAWAFARMRAPHGPALAALAGHSWGLLQDCLQQRCYRGTGKSLMRRVYLEREDHSARDGRVDAFDMMTLADTLWAFAELKLKQPPLMALAGDYMGKGLAQPAQLATRFIRYPEALVKCLCPYAQLAVAHHSLFRAAAPHCLRHLEGFKAQHVVSLAWAWAVSGPWDEAVQRRLRGRLCGTLSEGTGLCTLDAEDVHRAAWALDAMGLDCPAGLEVLADSALLQSSPPQVLATLRDAPTSHPELWRIWLRSSVEAAAEFLGSLGLRAGEAPSWHSGSYAPALQQLGVEHFGYCGTQALLELLRFQDAPSEATSFAMELLVGARGTTGLRCGSCAVMYCLRAADGSILLEGCACYHALHEQELCCKQSGAVARRQPLRAAQLLVGRAADRQSCAEFLALSHLCDQLGGYVDIDSAASRAVISGVVFLHLLAAPCISGIGAARQFRVLFGGVVMSISFED